jgi:DNA-binding transcriptional LysR family regulator
VVQEEFRRHGLAPRIVVRATDANVIKAYVAAGLGIAVLREMAIERETDSALVTRNTKGLFPDSSAQISIRSGKYLRACMQAFIDMVLAAKTIRLPKSL